MFTFVNLSHNLLCGHFKLRVASVLLGFLSSCSLKQHLKMWSLHYIPFCPICVGIIKVPFEHSACFLPLWLFCIFLRMLQLVLPSWQGRQEYRDSSPVMQNYCSSCLGLGFQFLQYLCYSLPFLAWSFLHHEHSLLLSVPCMLYLCVTVVHSLPHFHSLSNTWVFSYCSMCSSSPFLFLRLKTFRELLVFQLCCWHHIWVTLWLLSIPVCPLTFSGLLFCLQEGQI